MYKLHPNLGIPNGIQKNNPKIFKENQVDIPLTRNVNNFPKHIIPQKSVAERLNLMANEASEKYDQKLMVHSKKSNTYSTKNPEVAKSEGNSEVLFFPGKESVKCNNKQASTGTDR